ncbi:chemotaxis protein CheD [Alicyclobacillus shizuokensis]|uniref:chemotaxis protein CheD n=1 Tax=Alicyclobacillus shizuokensis TaxID=392014 RepID=UPI00082DBDEC|nr:chemotaxis protein CheD [Alicyclobacillus shizuokensis]
MASEDSSVRRIGIGEGAVIQRPGRLLTVGLGSCIGVVIYDPYADVAGMVHVMLPAARDAEVAAPPQKYADLGTLWLVDAVIAAGGRPAQLQAKLAGGAHMFTGRLASPALRIGERNLESVVAALARVRVPVVAKDVGGRVGRTIEFDTATHQLWVRTARQTYAI